MNFEDFFKCLKALNYKGTKKKAFEEWKKTKIKLNQNQEPIK